MQTLSDDQPDGRSLQASKKREDTELYATNSETAAADVLAELHNLLNDHAPAWYTERHSQRTEEVLRTIGRL